MFFEKSLPIYIIPFIFLYSPSFYIWFCYNLHSFPSILIFMAKTFRMLLKRHIVRRAICGSSPIARSLSKEDYSWLPPSPSGRTLRSSFLSCLSSSSSRRVRLLFFLTTTASFHGMVHLRRWNSASQKFTRQKCRRVNWTNIRIS